MTWVWKRANCWNSNSWSLRHQNSWTALFFQNYHIKDHIKFKKHGKTSCNRCNSGRIFKVTDRDRRALKRIVGRKHRTTGAKVTAELNQHLNSPVSTRTSNNARYHGRAAIKKPLLSAINIQKRLKWCRDHKGWSAD